MTDIHITHFGHTDRTDQFEQFCNEIIKSLIKPQVTVISGNSILEEVLLIKKKNLGDLTHSRDRTFASEQYEQEWISYKNILIKTNVTKYTKWLDLKGNHGKNSFYFEYFLDF